MKNLKDREESFLEWRRNGIGSSDAPAVMGYSPWVTTYQLWELKTGRREPDPMNWAMKKGIELEPYARQAYEMKSGIQMPSDRMKHREHDFLRANFDGINKLARLVLEIKCPGQIDHARAAEGKIPDKYLWQCVHLLMVSRMPVLHYWSFDGENGILVKFKRNRELEEKLLTAEKKFWNHVLTDTPPLTGEIFKVRRNR
jgi:putative phage-type endonuclease